MMHWYGRIAKFIEVLGCRFLHLPVVESETLDLVR